MLPPNYILDEIRHLGGKARVTWPGQKLDVFKVERILKRPKTEDWNAKFPYYSADEEYSTAKLIDRQLVSQDNQYVTVYLVWHVLPGVLLDAIETDPETNAQYPVTRQIVAGTTALPANEGGIVWTKQPIDDVTDIHIKRDLSSLIGKKFIDYPELSYTFPGILLHRGRTLTERSQPASYRPSRSLIVRARRELFYTVEAEKPEIFQWIGVNIRSDAGSFGDVLHNLRSVEIGGRRQRVEESFPSASEYPIGQEVLIRAPSERGQNGLFRNEHIYIPLI